MRFRDLIISLISIGCFFMSSTTVKTQELPPKVFSGPINLVWNIHLQGLPNGWKIEYPGLQTPQAKTSVPKERPLPDDKWELVNNKFEDLDKNFGYV